MRVAVQLLAGSAEDVMRGYRLLRGAAAKDFPPALIHLANVYYFGKQYGSVVRERGVDRNWAEARNLLYRVLNKVGCGDRDNSLWDMTPADEQLARLLATPSTLVRLDGLASSPNLNGKIGTITVQLADYAKPDPQEPMLPERVCIALPQEQRPKGIRPRNLTPLAPGQPFAEAFNPFDDAVDSDDVEVADTNIIWEYAVTMPHKPAGIGWEEYPARISFDLETAFLGESVHVGVWYV